MNHTLAHYTIGLLRLSLGWIFLWAFLDKTFGWGFTTTPDRAWLASGSPTDGFLLFATKGPFAEFFKGLAGNGLVEWLFMLGLLFVGVAMILGIMVRLSAIAGAAMLMIFYLAGFLPPEHNPFMDEHITHSLVLLLVAFTDGGRFLGLGAWWGNRAIVRRFPVLK